MCKSRSFDSDFFTDILQLKSPKVTILIKIKLTISVFPPQRRKNLLVDKAHKQMENLH